MINSSGKLQEVAKLAAWLASDASSFLMGQVMTINGGRMSKLRLP